ncbi:hypothetical protein ACN3XK_15240 [Actinomadura welshii]
MTEALIEQIEFRWDGEYDLSAVAWSYGPDEQVKRWSDVLKPYVRVSGRGGSAAADAPSSAVYLTFGRDAALILRSVDPRALRTGTGRARSAGADRLDVVARALTGPSRLLTAEVAMRIAASDPLRVFKEPPGQVGHGTPLNPLEFSFLNNRSTPGDGLLGRARNVHGLAPLIAAVLTEPARPVTLVLPAEEIRGSLQGSRALALLWASRRVLELMLDDADARLASFSTCEAPLGGGDGRPEPAIAFRERGLDRPPLGEAPREVRPDDPIAVQDHLSKAAGYLADAYRLYGDECLELVRREILNCRTLAERIEAVASSAKIAVAVDSGPDSLGPPPLRPGNEPARQRAAARHAPTAHASTPHAPSQQASAPVTAPTHASPPAPSPASPTPLRGDPHLVRLYRMLSETKDPPGSLRIMDWIAARTARGAVLDADGFSRVLQLMSHNGWYVDRVGGLRDAPARMADLMQPLFAVEFGDGELEDQLRRRHQQGLDPVIADALGILATRLEPGRADWLADRCMAYALSRRPPDPFGDGGALHRPPAREPFPLRVLRLPGNALPDDLADALSWLAVVLLALIALWYLT